MDAAVFEQVYGAFGDFHAYFAPLFGRRETRDHSRHYLQALLVQSGERRNAENLSETVPASARVMQRFLAESPWDDSAVIGRLQEYLGPRLGHPDAVWVLDGSDFPKQGTSNRIGDRVVPEHGAQVPDRGEGGGYRPERSRSHRGPAQPASHDQPVHSTDSPLGRPTRTACHSCLRLNR